MKYLIFGDMHGKDLTKLEATLVKENPDSIICLGDFDNVKTIRNFIDIEEDYLKKGKEVIKVPGNHDYAILNNQPITSGTIIASGKNYNQLHEELFNDKKAREYMENLLNSDFSVRGFLDASKFGKEYPFVVMHGGYFGDISSYRSCPEEIKPLWNRLNSEKDFQLNFEEMEKRKEKIMIRGHDHLPVYALQNKDILDITYSSTGDTYSLNGSDKHIINPGTLFYGHFTTIDTSGKIPLLNYKHL